MRWKGFPGDRIPGNRHVDTDEFQRQSKSVGGMFIDGSSVPVGKRKDKGVYSNTGNDESRHEAKILEAGAPNVEMHREGPEAPPE